MGSHPVNLFLRFALEVLALIIFGFWGASLADGMMGILFAFFIPISIATLWGVFAVPNDPSRSGKAPVPISGLMRLVLEFLFFSFAVYCLFQLDFSAYSISFGVIVIGHYTASHDRISWLFKQK